MNQSPLSQLAPAAALKDCAVVVIDMQNDFLAEGGAFDQLGYDLTAMQAIIPRLAAFLKQVRSLGGQVIYVRHIFDPGKLSPAMRARGLRLFGSEEGFSVPHTWGAQIHPLLTPADNEPLFDKHWYNAFSNPHFEAALTGRGVQTLALCGVLTNVCVETTARASNTRDFHTVVIEDCTASNSDALHQAALETLRTYFGWVCPAADLLALWIKQPVGSV